MVDFSNFKGPDHVGITVPNIEEATNWFIDIFNAEVLFSMGPISAEDDWMATNFNVHPKAILKAVRMLRMRNGMKLELLEYEAPDQRDGHPRNSDWGGYHIAFCVDNMAEAIADLKAKNVQFSGKSKVFYNGPCAGLSWIYFYTPWGLQLELVSFSKRQF